MSEIKLFSITGNVKELESNTFDLEVELQRKIEENMDVIFQVDYLTSEYSFNGGRIDSLGIDENNSPVIFEYKRNMNENVINQGLFYLEWLLDHKADFELLVRDKYGKGRSNQIEWNNPVVYCIANGFTRYDVNAVKQMQRNIRLIEYKKYNGILLFDFLNLDLKVKPIQNIVSKVSKQRTIEDRMQSLNEKLKPILVELRNYIISISEDVNEVVMKQYIAYKKVNNFVTLDLTNDKIQIYLKLNPDDVEIKENMRDMRGIGHFGTGDVEIIIRTVEDYKYSLEYIDLAFMKN
ncbi:DUF5655 domain-containing protein [Erysipelothrix urinaevulpis]|uniref:DUF5655 domain-containing protein n=1 Tax=Erysipelothrix urinaevulpis TaxID=2683717 RepID=UPI001357A472|nr:DUF5655 domain-containing protein [Erysipelothrix urinaevulpis]